MSAVAWPKTVNDICEHLLKTLTFCYVNRTLALFCLGGPIMLTDLHSQMNAENNSAKALCRKVIRQHHTLGP